MLKQPISFTDFNGETREEDIYFNLTEAELVDWQADSEEGLQKEMMDAVKSKDMRKLLDFIKTLVFKAYGERDKDGIHFNKSPEISQRFVNSAMYSPLLMALFADEGTTTTAFVNGLMPPDLVKKAMEQGNIPGSEDIQVPDLKPSARELFAQASNSLQETSGVNSAAPIGGSPMPAAPVQSTPSTQDAAPVQVGQVSEAPAQDAPHPFRVEETPMDEGAAEALRLQKEAEDAEYAEWRRRRAAGEL